MLARKLEKGKTPVYNYIFAWEYPVNGGITAFHSSEIAFAFHNVGEPHRGSRPAALRPRLPCRIRSRRRGSTSPARAIRTSRASSGSPTRCEEPQTMVFDTVSESRALRDDKLVSLLPATRAAPWVDPETR